MNDDPNNSNWADFIVRETETVLVTMRVHLTVADGMISFDPTPSNIIAYHVECKAHSNTKRRIRPDQAMTVEDSISFCPHCLAHEAEQQRQPDPLAEKLRYALDYASHSPFVDFIESMDL